MKPLIILLLFIAAVQLPGRATAQDQKVPIKTSDGAIVRTKQEPLPIKPGSGAPIPRTMAASQVPQGGKPVSAIQLDKTQPVTTAAGQGKVSATTSTLPTEQLIKPVNKDLQPPKIEQQQGPVLAPVPVKSGSIFTPQPAKQ